MPAPDLGLNPSALKWSDCTTRILRELGVPGDADWLVTAHDALKSAIRKWQNKRRWTWMLVTAADIDLISATSTYTLPTSFLKPFTARLKDRKLIWAPQALYDMLIPDNSGTDPTYYSMFNAADTGKITLLPNVPTATFVSGVDVLRVRYWRKLAVGSSGSDTALLDIPEEFEDGVIAYAKYLSQLAMDAADPRANAWRVEGEMALRDAVLTDANQPDADEGFIPGGIVSSNYWNPNSLAVLLPHDDW